MCLHLSANSVSAGQLLCSGLFSSDGLSTWFASVALLHAIVENSTQKEQLLRVQLATSLGHPPVSLLQQCTNILTQVTELNLLCWREHSQCKLSLTLATAHYSCLDNAVGLVP